MADHEVTIVGAGFGGMGAAISLTRLGYGTASRDLLILEREDDLGGTSTSRSYYYTNEGDAVILRPTSSRSARKAVESFPISDYELA